MKRKSPRASAGASECQLGGDVGNPSTSPATAQIVALPRYPRRRVGVRQVEGGWQAVILLADGRPSPRYKASRVFEDRGDAILAARRAAEASGLPLDLSEAPDDDGPIAA